MPTTTASYTVRPGSLSGPISMRRGGVSSFYVRDMQGTTRQLTDASQNVTDTLVTDAWGWEVASTGTTVNPYKSFGQWGYYKDAANRQYVRARHLRNDLGRWVSRDPILDVGYSQYPCVHNRPLFFVDPSGLLDFDITSNPAPISDCGGARMDIKWKGWPIYGDGTIIQRIQFIPSVYDCNNRPIPWPHNTAIKYWEAWHVIGGDLYGGEYPRDVWYPANSDTFATADEGNGTHGCVTISGLAQYWDRYHAYTPPWMHRVRPFPSLDLVSLLPRGPNGWNESRGVKRTFKACWNCCCSPHLKTKVYFESSTR
jgi:RHS repeat-associated protein